MKSLQITRFGGPEVLQLMESKPSQLGPSEVRVEVAAAGVNFADLMMRMGLYPEAPKPPFVPGYEISGTITEIGSEVKGFKPGDRILAGTQFGGYTTEIILPSSQVLKTPERLTDIEAAAIPVNFLTAALALEEMGRVRKGDRVLVQSAAGGVGIAAVQIASQVGAQVVGLTSSMTKAETIRTMGAKEVLTYDQWISSSDKEMGGFDIVLDSTGGDSLKRSFRRLSPTGRVVCFGVSNLVAGERRSFTRLISTFSQTFFFTPFKLMMENKGIFGLNLLKIFEQGDRSSFQLIQVLNRLLQKFDDGSYQVKIGKTFPLSEGGAAHLHLQSRSNIGKVVLTTK